MMNYFVCFLFLISPYVGFDPDYSNLGHEECDIREQAEQRLQTNVHYLRSRQLLRLTRSTDTEIAYRAKRILNTHYYTKIRSKYLDIYPCIWDLPAHLRYPFGTTLVDVSALYVHRAENVYDGPNGELSYFASKLLFEDLILLGIPNYVIEQLLEKMFNK